MKVAKTNQSDNPASNVDQDAEEAATQARETVSRLAEQLLDNVAAAANESQDFDSTERAVFSSVLQIGFQAMELFVSLQGDGDLGPEVTPSEGKPLQRSEVAAHTVVRSIFGEHHFHEFTYAPGKNKAIGLRPTSARMSLPNHRWSFLLQEISQMLCVDQAFSQAMENLGQILGGKFSVDTAERVNAALGTVAEEFLDDLPKPEPNSEAKLLVASADCKGVPLVKEDSEKVAAFETAKKNPGNRRMATVASVYSVDPHTRTAEEVTAALFRDEPQEEEVPAKRERPRPQNKNTTAHFPEAEDDGNGELVPISGIHVGMAWLIAQIAQRRQAGQVLLVLMDGQESLWETFKLHMSFGPRTVPILDILHALSYVWKASALFEKGDEARKAFTRRRLLRILRGEVRGVIRGLRQLGTTRKLSGEALKKLNRICSYLEKNADRMQYDVYLRRGYPIASGVIEGACRHLVKDRMERSGMRWTLEGARGMLNVRAAFQSDHWRTFLNARAQKEVATVHRHRNLIPNVSQTTLAC